MDSEGVSSTMQQEEYGGTGAWPLFELSNIHSMALSMSLALVSMGPCFILHHYM